MTEEKIINLAKNLIRVLPQSESPTMFYYEFMRFIKNKEDYFLKFFNLEQLIKLIICCWFLKKGEESKIKYALSNLRYIATLHHDNEHNEDICKKCDGSGKEDCAGCDAKGSVDCTHCDGEGDYVCDNCNGFGCGVCGYSGTLRCENCKGVGGIKCRFCDGRGEVDCEYCDFGEFKSNYIRYYITYLVTWSESLYLRAMYCEESGVVFLSTDDLLDYADDIIKIYDDYNPDFEFTPYDYTNKGDYYVIGVSDEFPKNMQIDTSSPTKALKWIEPLKNVKKYGYVPK